ncbi:MAG: beta-aspartyl-peptidase [Pseudomonadota bacterium]
MAPFIHRTRSCPVLTLLLNARLATAPPSDAVSTLLIGGGKVLWFGTHTPRLDDALEVDVVDLDGALTLPGLIDGHTHMTGGGGESGFASRVPPVALSHYTSAGVTSAVGLLGTDDTTRDTQSLVASAYGLRELGLGAWCYTGGYHVPPVTLTGSVRGDIVNVDPILGVGELALSDHRSSQPTLEELLRVASDCHVAGLITGKAGICHLHLGDGPRGLSMVREALALSELPPRVFNPTHINRQVALFEEALILARSGCYVDITAYELADGDAGYGAVEAMQRYLASAAPADRITISSDGGGCLPQFDADGVLTHMDIGTPATLAGTLKALLQHGADLQRTVAAFTANPARLLRLPGKGVIAEGADADLVVLDAQYDIDSVMLGGAWHRRHGEQLVRGPFEQR